MEVSGQLHGRAVLAPMFIGKSDAMKAREHRHGSTFTGQLVLCQMGRELKLNSVALVRDRATAACWRSWCKLLRIEGIAWSARRILYNRILASLDRSRYFFFQVAPQLYSRGCVDPVPDPLLLRKSGSARTRTRTSGSVARNSDHDHRGGPKYTCCPYQRGQVRAKEREPGRRRGRYIGGSWRMRTVWEPSRWWQREG
jgi:hypothetical protein